MSYRVVLAGAAQAAAHVAAEAAAADGEGVPAPLLVLPPDVVVQTAPAEGEAVAAEEPVCTAAAVPLGVAACVAVALPALVADADGVPVGDGGSTSRMRRCTPPPHIASHDESMRQSLYRQTGQNGPPAVALPLADALPLALELGVGSAVRLLDGVCEAQPCDAGCNGLTAGVGAALTLGATLLGSQASISHRKPTYPVSSSVVFPFAGVLTSKCT